MLQPRGEFPTFQVWTDNWAGSWEQHLQQGQCREVILGVLNPQQYLHPTAGILGELQVQPLLAGVQTVDDILVSQFPRPQCQARQVPVEELCQAQVSTWGGKGRAGVSRRRQ